MDVVALKNSQEIVAKVGLRREKSTRIVNKDSRNDGSVHSYHEEEKEGLVEYVNGLLQQQVLRQPHRPINSKSNDIFEHLKDGVLLIRIINAIQPGLIEDSRINNKEKLSVFEKGENLMLALQVAKEAFNISFVNIGVEDVLEGRMVLVLSLLWQLITIDLRRRVRVHSREVEYLQHDEEDGAGADRGEEDEAMLEEYKILLRWINHHLAEAGIENRVHNFSGDLKDSVAYTVLLHRLSPKECTLDALAEPNLLERAILFLQSAEQIGCKKFVTAEDIVMGNSRLNFAFIAYLFTKFHQPPKPAETRSAEERLKVQEIELADIHSQNQVIIEKVTEIQDKIKESSFQLAVKKEELVKEEKQLQQRLTTLEEHRRLQAYSYKAQITELKNAVVKAQQQSHLPSEAELTAAIAAESAEQEVILKEREELLVKIQDVRGDVSSRITDRQREEALLERTTAKINKMEKEHTEKTKSITEKIDSLGISALQKKLDEAITQNAAKSEVRATLARTRDTLSSKIEGENVARSKASIARQRVEEELAKAKKNVTEANTTKKRVVAASNRLERQIMDVKSDTTQLKKDAIFVAYQTQLTKEDTEDVCEKTVKVADENVVVSQIKENLENETEILEKEIVAHQMAFENEVKTITQENEEQLEINRKSNNVVVEQMTEEKTKASVKMISAVVGLNAKQMETNMQSALKGANIEKTKALQRELEFVQQTVEEEENKTVKLLEEVERAKRLIWEEENLRGETERQIDLLASEKDELDAIKEEKLRKRTDLAYTARVAEMEANQTILLASHLSSTLSDLTQDERDLRNSLREKKATDKIASEERKRDEVLEAKAQAHARALQKEKEVFEKKAGELRIGSVSGGGSIGNEDKRVALELEKEAAKLQQERQLLHKQKQELAGEYVKLHEEAHNLKTENVRVGYETARADKKRLEKSTV